MEQSAFEQGLLPGPPTQDITTINMQNQGVPIPRPQLPQLIASVTPNTQFFNMAANDGTVPPTPERASVREPLALEIVQ